MLDKVLTPELEVTEICNIRKHPAVGCGKYCYRGAAGGEKVMPLETFKRIISWLDEISPAIKQENGLEIKKQAVYLGGEPTQYPLLRESLDFLREKDWEARVFTNGVFGQKVLDLLNQHESVQSILFHFESRYEENAPALHKTILRNIEGMNNGNTRERLLRFNLHTDFLTHGLIDLAADSNSGIAYSVTTPAPGLGEYVRHNILGQVGEILIKELYEPAIAKGIPLYLARPLPKCMFTDEQIAKYKERADIQTVCTAINDLTFAPNGDMQLCSIDSGYKLKTPNNPEELRDNIRVLIAREAAIKESSSFDQCDNCGDNSCGVCQGGCLANKLYGDKK